MELEIVPMIGVRLPFLRGLKNTSPVVDHWIRSCGEFPITVPNEAKTEVCEIHADVDYFIVNSTIVL